VSLPRSRTAGAWPKGPPIQNTSEGQLWSEACRGQGVGPAHMAWPKHCCRLPTSPPLGLKHQQRPALTRLPEQHKPACMPCLLSKQFVALPKTPRQPLPPVPLLPAPVLPALHPLTCASRRAMSSLETSRPRSSSSTTLSLGWIAFSTRSPSCCTATAVSLAFLGLGFICRQGFGGCGWGSAASCSGQLPSA